MDIETSATSVHRGSYVFPRLERDGAWRVLIRFTDNMHIPPLEFVVWIDPIVELPFFLPHFGIEITKVDDREIADDTFRFECSRAKIRIRNRPAVKPPSRSKPLEPLIKEELLILPNDRKKPRKEKTATTVFMPTINSIDALTIFTIPKIDKREEKDVAGIL